MRYLDLDEREIRLKERLDSRGCAELNNAQKNGLPGGGQVPALSWIFLKVSKMLNKIMRKLFSLEEGIAVGLSATMSLILPISVSSSLERMVMLFVGREYAGILPGGNGLLDLFPFAIDVRICLSFPV